MPSSPGWTRWRPRSSRAGSRCRASSGGSMSGASDSPGAWTDLGGGVFVRQSRAYHMNSLVLLDSEHTVLVDPGVLPSELDDLARLVRQAEPEAVTLLLSHSHWDH